MRNKLGSVCMALGLVLLAAALALLLYNRWDNNRARQAAAQVQSALESAVAENAAAPEAEPVGPGMATVEIDGYEYIGTLTIPTLELELPVMEEWSYPGLKIAPGRYVGSLWTDDLVICGHNYVWHFGNLKYLEAGDALQFTDVNGNVLQYQVEEVVILQPTDVEEMISQDTGEWDLTLFTCTIGGQTRVTVRCSRTA
ncbi:MAG: sortase [Clostridiales bacterium]|nr:sortase [Clostridiales bacterium]